MNEEIEYAEMLEIPHSTVNVVHKKRRKKAENEQPKNGTLKESVIASVNDRMEEPKVEEPAPLPVEEEGSLQFDPIPERIDTVRLYDTKGEGKELYPYDYSLNEGGRYKTKGSRGARIALGIEFGAACALCAGIFLTNVFMPSSAINTFFRAMSTPTEPTATVKPYTDFTLGSVVSEMSEAELTLSPTGILSFTDACCVYPAANGTVSEVIQNADGSYILKINHEDAFTGVFTGLNTVYYEVGDDVKVNVPVGYTSGEAEVQVTIYADGQLLNCFELTEENCLAWVAQ